MNESLLKYIKVGNFWQIDGTEIFLHVPFLKNSSDNYLKRIFKNDFGLELNDEQLKSLRNPRQESITMFKV
jgi:hypothetical protein